MTRTLPVLALCISLLALALGVASLEKAPPPPPQVVEAPRAQPSDEVLELRNLVETASLVVECAIRRHESRGLHYTLDYPKLDETRPPADTVVRRY